MPRGSKDNPCLFGEFFRIIKDYLVLSNNNISELLDVNINTVSAWATSKQKPSREKCSKLIDVFKNKIANLTVEDEKIFSGYLKYYVDKSDLVGCIKNDILSIDDINKLIGMVLTKTNAFNKSVGKRFVEINLIPQEELGKYNLNIKKDKIDDQLITHNIYVNTTNYKRLVKQIEDKRVQIKDLQKLLVYIPEGKTDEKKDILIKINFCSEELKSLNEELDELKRSVVELFEFFTKMEIGTERLGLANKLFLEGNFEGANAMLKSEDLNDDQKTLLKRLTDNEKEKKELEKGLINNSNEYLVKAQLTAVNFAIPNRIEETSIFFEKSLTSMRTPKALFEYALFLQKHLQFNKAQILYEEALIEYEKLAQVDPVAFEACMATTLNNLAILHWDNKDFAAAETAYKKALEIYECLAQADKAAFESYVAMALNNLAILYKDRKEYIAAETYYKKALDIRERLARENPEAFEPDVAMVLNNIANLYKEENSYIAAETAYKNALEIYERLAKTNPLDFESYVATTLNNLANLYKDNNDFTAAETYYKKALEIRERLIQMNLEAFEPDMAVVINNLANLYRDRNEYAQA